MLTDVLAIKLPQKIGMLYTLLDLLVAKDVSIEYMYTLATGNNASIVAKVSDVTAAIEVLEANHFELFKAEEAYKINHEE